MDQGRTRSHWKTSYTLEEIERLALAWRQEKAAAATVDELMGVKVKV